MIKKMTLIKENEKLKKQIFIFENIGIGLNASIEEKEIAAKAFLSKYPDYNLYEVSRAIKICKGTLYNFLYTKVEKPWFIKRDEILVNKVKEVFENSKRLYGIARIVLALKKEGINTSEKKVRKIMTDNNLKKRIIFKKKKEIQTKYKRTYFRNIVKGDFQQDAPNKVWVSDFLEINVKGVKFYLCVILDLYARKVIAWRLSHKLSDNLIINTFKDGFELRNEPFDLIFHSDQGSQFKSFRFREMLRMLGVKQSFSFPGNPYDNACMEGFYSRLRAEEINVNIEKYDNSLIIKQYLKEYFNFYNDVRIHTANNGLTPSEKEKEWYDKNTLKCA